MNRISNSSTPSSGCRRRGFGSAAAVMLVALGSLALAIAAMRVSADYADAVGREELRIQRRLDLEACGEAARLIRQKNVFASGVVMLYEFDCAVHL